MRGHNNKRFGMHEVTKGKLKGALHVATKAYLLFIGELSILSRYLNSRLLPQATEEVYASTIILSLQNILEYEIELVIASYIDANKTAQNQSFLRKIDNGFVSFKKKFEWSLKKNLITKKERDVMEQVRSIRNAMIHSRPKLKRTKLKYFGKQLLTRKAIEQLFTDTNSLVLRLRSVSGNKEKWPIIPPGYAEEMGWIK